MRSRGVFGSKAPSASSQRASFLAMLTNARDIEALPSPSALANMYKVDAREVEYLIGVERRRRSS